MFLILNRLRGTDGVWSKFNGMLLAYLFYALTHNHYIALSVGLGYIIGESFGWGEWDTLATNRSSKMPTPYTEGNNNGIQWIASKIINPSIDWINHCRVALTIRGFYWWLPTLAPLYFVGFSIELLTLMILALSIGFPIACELGYYFRDKVSFEKYGLSYSGGWEIQDGFYGAVVGLVFMILRQEV